MTTTPKPLSRLLTFLMALAIGVIVANLYYLQPLLHQLRGEFHVGTAAASTLITFVQIGYAAGLAFILPLGDLVPRRRLVVTIFVAAAALVMLGATLHTFVPFAIVTLFIGLASVGGQVLVPFAADLAEESERGRVIGRVMTGLLLGILLSRTISGLITQVAGWRSVYWFAGATMLVMAYVLHRVLPDEPVRAHLSYGRLVRSTFDLFVNLPTLRRRSWLGALGFANFSVLWTTLSYHLSIAPFHYSNAVIGLFGLFGVAGVVAANTAGHFADKQRGHVTTLVSALLTTSAWAVLYVGRGSFSMMAIGIIMLDAAMQGMQITNQSVIYSLLPESRSRINSVFMVSCFIGASAGSYASGQLYASYGWTGVCWLGFALGAGQLLGALAWRTPVRREMIGTSVV